MEKINIAELLKNCPTGMELDCSVFEDVTLYRIDTDTENEYPIRIKTKNDYFLDLTKYGTYSNVKEAKCVIFPKSETSWDGFHGLFKDGDILLYKHKSNNVKYTFIYKRRIDMHYVLQYCGWFSEKPYLSEQFNAKERMPLYENDDIRFATEEEKQKLFDAIKANGYKWNAETKTLEKLPKFKVGDRIRRKNNTTIIKTIGHIYSDGYALYDGHLLYFKEQDEWELAPNKFDTNTLKPFDKVLVRNTNNGKWCGQFYMDYNKNEDYPFECTYNCWKYCIPYEGNEHLRGTTDECSNYYKTWKE